MAGGRVWPWLLGGFVGFAALAIAATIGCASAQAEARTRLARHFGLDDVSSEQAIEARLAAKLPAGTSEGAIYDFLGTSSIAEDPYSSWRVADKERVISCRIRFDPTTFGLVKESWAVDFRLDERRTLAGIRVQSWLTGL